MKLDQRAATERRCVHRLRCRRVGRHQISFEPGLRSDSRLCEARTTNTAKREDCGYNLETWQYLPAGQDNIPVLFEVFWPKRAQKSRNGLILESPGLSSQSISGFSGRKGAWASQACRQPLVPIPEKRLPKGPWSPETKNLPVLTATHILGSRLFAGAPNPDKRLPKGPRWLWPVLSATHICVGKPLFEGPNSQKKAFKRPLVAASSEAHNRLGELVAQWPDTWQ